MGLLKLPEKVQRGLLAGAPEYVDWRVRRGLGEVKSYNLKVVVN
jgi:hypothetical protein